MSLPTKWNVIRATLIGFFCGAAYSVVNAALNSEVVATLQGSELAARYVGNAIGGGFGGGLLFGLTAVIRNAFAK